MMPDRELTVQLIHQFKEHNRIMSQIADDIAAIRGFITTITTNDAAKDAKITDLETQLAAAQAQLAAVDPNAQAELTAATAEVAALKAELDAIVNPPAPVPAATLFTQVDTTATVDPATWTRASVNTDQGVALYTPVDASAAIDPAVWTAYTGTTVPVA